MIHTQLKKILFTVIMLLTILASNAQDGPPPAAMPTENNKALIDKLIKVTSFENYFRNYIAEKVKKAAEKEKWATQKKQQIIKSIDFKYFSFSVYNAFSFYSAEELKEMIGLFEKLNSKKRSKVIVTDGMIEYNLDLFAQSIIEGKYVMN